MDDWCHKSNNDFKKKTNNIINNIDWLILNDKPCWLIKKGT